jgi:hypothetical protein
MHIVYRSLACAFVCLLSDTNICCSITRHLGFARPEYLPDARGFEDFAGYLNGGCDHYTEKSGCATDTWRSGMGVHGPDPRNGTGMCCLHLHTQH